MTGTDPGRRTHAFHHTFSARARLELEQGATPDVLQDLLDIGVTVHDLAPTMPDAQPQDAALKALSGPRRPVVDGPCGRTADTTPGLRLVTGMPVTRPLVVEGTSPVTVSGVVCDGEAIRGDLVVDAGGRRSPVRRWLEGRARRPRCRGAFTVRDRIQQPLLPAPRGRRRAEVAAPAVVELGDLGFMGFGIGRSGTVPSPCCLPSRRRTRSFACSRNATAWDAAAPAARAHERLRRPRGRYAVDGSRSDARPGTCSLPGSEMAGRWPDSSPRSVTAGSPRTRCSGGARRLRSRTASEWQARFVSMATTSTSRGHAVPRHAPGRSRATVRTLVSTGPRSDNHLERGSDRSCFGRHQARGAALWAHLSCEARSERERCVVRQSLLALPNDVWRDDALVDRVNDALDTHPFDPHRTSPGPPRHCPRTLEGGLGGKGGR